MKKKILMLLCVFMLLSVPALAKNVNVTIPQFDVKFNGTEVENEYRQFPLIVYKDITYFPMTYYDSRFLGLETMWDNDTRTLAITKENITCAYRDYNLPWKNSGRLNATICDFNIVINEKEVENSKEEYPLLTFNDVTYFPLTWRFAVDEFGWEYSFTTEKGLDIQSDNYHTEVINLPYASDGVITDGEYYYYNGVVGEKRVVLRAEAEDVSKYEIIHELPDTPVSRSANFSEENGEVYISYSAGSGAIMSTQYYYKIEKNGTLTNQKPKNYSGGKHGYSETTVEEDGIFVRFENKYVDSGSDITYKIGDNEYDVEEMPGRVRLGKKRNGLKDDNANKGNCIQIYKGKIYYVATDLDTNDDSALYCIDTKTGEHKKILDSIMGFHVYNGWVAEEKADSTMIVYDNNGKVMRYTELNNDIREVYENENNEGLMLDSASGDFTIYAVLKSIYGNKTVVRAYSNYAAGASSLNGATMLETKTGTSVAKSGKWLIVKIHGESSEDKVRLIVIDSEGFMNSFKTSDVVGSVFVYQDILLYTTDGNKVVKVNLGEKI